MLQAFQKRRWSCLGEREEFHARRELGF